MFARFTLQIPMLATGLAILAAWTACGGEDSPAPAAKPKPAPAVAKPAPAPDPAPAAVAKSDGPQDLDRGILLALAQFVTQDGKPIPGPARVEFLTLEGGRWNVTSIEDPESNVFHKAMVYDGSGEPVLLTLGGTRAIVKTWEKGADGLTPTSHWEKEFGGKFEERISRVVSETLTRAGVPSGDEIRTLTQRVEELTSKVEELAAR